ncbi:peroxisomal biogenesis factor 3-like [Corticium candelabrum]|uniref:peroxisomal biogenesis factor 3-like n=1 Tax=Corticium candelabrum TaxID=121492 RepID=UPI002E27430F|nr:peroxisomal biogenesis factor 3-like [Corticium candelabrum]
MASFVAVCNRHKRKLLLSGAIFVGGYVAFKLVKWHLSSRAAECEAFLINEARLEHHFESNQRTCDMTVRSLLPALKQALYENLDVERLKVQLKSTSSANALQLWEDMKITTVTQLIVSVYTCCFLVVFLRLQLNILGGNMYLDSLNEEGGNGLVEVEAFSQSTRDAVCDVFRLVSLKEQLTVERLWELISCVCQNIEGTHGRKEASPSRLDSFVAFILPVDSMDAACSSLLQNEQDEMKKLNAATKDFLESNDFHHVLVRCITRGLQCVVKTLEQQFDARDGHKGHVANGSLPLAKILPIITNIVPELLDDSGQLLQTVTSLSEVQKFAENVYDAFSK